jgi:hypothetical protein
MRIESIVIVYFDSKDALENLEIRAQVAPAGGWKWDRKKDKLAAVNVNLGFVGRCKSK